MLINTAGGNAALGAERDKQLELARYHATRAAELDPSLASIPALVSDMQTWRWSGILTAAEGVPDPLGQGATWLYSYAGEHEKAIARARRWAELDPKNWSSIWTLAVVHAYAGDWDEAAGLHRDTIEIAPAVPVVRLWSARVEIARGNLEAASGELERAEQLLGGNRQAVLLPELACAYSRIGRQADADRIVAEIEQLSRGGVEVGTGGWAMVHLARGDRGAVVEQLEAAIVKMENHELDEGFYNLMNVRMNVTSDPVLEEPELVRLRERLRGD